MSELSPQDFQTLFLTRHVQLAMRDPEVARLPEDSPAKIAAEDFLYYYLHLEASELVSTLGQKATRRNTARRSTLQYLKRGRSESQWAIYEDAVLRGIEAARFALDATHRQALGRHGYTPEWHSELATTHPLVRDLESTARSAAHRLLIAFGALPIDQPYPVETARSQALASFPEAVQESSYAELHQGFAAATQALMDTDQEAHGRPSSSFAELPLPMLKPLGSNEAGS